MASIISAEDLGKCYLIRHQTQHQGRSQYTALRDILAQQASQYGRKLLGAIKGQKPSQEGEVEEFWALRGVNFDIQEGEAVGIIGHNGAGKSTLLKILSRITEPSRGKVVLRGRVASLLEVGTGFHPELTGRENIFLNGAVLGMKRTEVKKKFDEIVAFAGVERFLDTPVKRYSSGMYVRLAFAVAAHLEPEILVVDEVLAVGDAEFQKKCLGKMQDVAKGGRTVLFVSHHMGSIQRLTQRAILLKSGQVAFDGPTREAVGKYLEQGASDDSCWSPGFSEKKPYPHFVKAFLCDEQGRPCGQATTDGHFGVEIEFHLPNEMSHLLLSVDLLNESEHVLFATSPLDSDRKIPVQPGRYRTRVMFPKAILMPRLFSVRMTLYVHGALYDRGAPAFCFRVEQVASLANRVSNSRMGDFQIHCEWSPIIEVK